MAVALAAESGLQGVVYEEAGCAVGLHAVGYRQAGTYIQAATGGKGVVAQTEGRVMGVAAQEFAAQQPATRKRIRQVGTGTGREGIQPVILGLCMLGYHGGIGQGYPSAHAHIG